MNYYNEIDPYCAAWLQNLMDAGHIARGDIDTRSIEDVTPNDVRGYTQCHWFAGLGGWAHALDLAGWPRDRPVWTGSCPCQPFSAAGKGAGFADERHLWPAWYHLISQCLPAVLYGEQVARAAEWIDLVCGDLEALDYAVECRPISAGAVGSEQIRSRVWIVADSIKNGLNREGISPQQRKSVSCTSRSFNGFPWTSTPVPANAADYRDVLLLAHGIPSDLASIAAYGNAIVPQVAEQFIEAYCEARGLMLPEMEAAA